MSGETINTHGLIEVEDIEGIDENAVSYVYITIPKEYVLTYHKIMILFAEYGEEMLNDCKASCKDRNKNIVDCYNMFNSAIAALHLGKTSLANTIMTYVNTTIDNLYPHLNTNTYVFNVDDRGLLRVLLTDEVTPSMYIDPDDGNLYQTYVESCYNHGYTLVGDNNEYIAIEE